MKKKCTIIPICENDHWIVIVLFNLCENKTHITDKKQIAKPFILVIDIHSIDLHVVYPQKHDQPNLDDCGLYLIKYVEEIFDQ